MLAGTADLTAGLLAASRWATDLLAADPGAAAVLGSPDEPVALADARTSDELLTAYRRELLRLAARDLGGLDALPATTAALSRAAEVLWHRALALHDVDGVAVVGMGKLGARELNYASDVDVVLVAADADVDERRVRAALALVRRAVRVDLDLRPEGRNGALLRTVPAYEAYWERWASPWERQALLKARPIAGDAGLGARWAGAAAEVVWGRPFGADDIRSVRALKARAEADVRRRGSGERDLKRGLGGIRDIEFAVQLLQLVHGGADGALRRPDTLSALAELASGGYVAAPDAESLADAYVHLRTVEHRLQLVDLRPAHVLPSDPAALDRLARSLGHVASGRGEPAGALLEALRHQRAAARAVHEKLWFRPLLGAYAGRERTFAAFGFADAERSRAALAELTRGLTRSSRLMHQLLPVVLEWLSLGPDPDLGLLGLRRLVDRPQRAAALTEAFRDSPEGARRLCTLLTTSALLGDLLWHNPDLASGLADDDALAPVPGTLLDGARAAVAWREDTEDRRLALKRFTDREGLRIAAADVLGIAHRRAVGAALSELAEAAVVVAADTVLPVASGAEAAALGIVALGRFGGRELSYPSDLDLVLVASGDLEDAERAATRLRRFLGTGAPHLYDVDLDLRPEGRDGPLVRSLDSWRTYVERWAEPWERLAWVKARPVGDSDLARQLVDEVLVPWVFGRPVTDAERRSLRRIKARVERERVRPGDDRDFLLKLGPGGLTDIEFCVQLLQLERGIRTTSTVDALAALDDPALAPLAEAHAFLEHVRDRLFLVTGDPGDALPARPERLARLATSLDTTPAELRDEHRRLTRRARRVVEERFYGS